MDDEKTFIVIEWPEVKKLFSNPEFHNNAELITMSPLYEEFGDSAYLVRKSWLDKNINK